MPIHNYHGRLTLKESDNSILNYLVSDYCKFLVITYETNTYILCSVPMNATEAPINIFL